MRKHKVVTTEPVLRHLDESHQREDHREVRFDLWSHPLKTGLKPYAAVEVMEDRGDGKHNEQHDEEPVNHELVERQFKNVEADVVVKLSIFDAPRHAVLEQNPFLPLRRRAKSHHHAKQQRNVDTKAPGVGQHVAAIAIDDFVFDPRSSELRRQAVGDYEVH